MAAASMHPNGGAGDRHKKEHHSSKRKAQFITNGGTGDQSASRRARLAAEREALPVWAARRRIVEEAKENGVLILVGETGSGKTTQVPQILLKAGLAAAAPHERTAVGAGGSGGGTGGGGGSNARAIAVTQPRRVAAVTVARRVAEEMGVKLGEQVGYAVRFDDCSGPGTRIRYVTDGLLLREALADPLLSRYQVVIVDEAHERTVATDVLLGLLKGVAARRGAGFKLFVMSATLDAGAFSRYFNGARAVWVRGRQHPVALHATAQPEDNYLDAAVNATLQVHCDEGAGDVLVFLTGQDEIEAAERMINERAARLDASASGAAAPSRLTNGGGGDGGGGAEGAGGEGARPERLLALPIYASLPPEQQMRVFEPAPPGTRKVVLATNIAETSITIPGVRFVIDAGFVKARGYHAGAGAESLQVVPVSQAQARQRAGRAGREGPGKAYRLYTHDAFLALSPTTPPEILRSNLAATVLQLKALGVPDVLNFDFMDKPPRAAVVRSLELLFSLGALDATGALTAAVGARLARLPVDPMFGKVLLAAAEMGCLVEAVQVVGLVSADGIFYSPRHKREAAAAARARFVSPEGDHLTLLAALHAYLKVPKKQRSSWTTDHFINPRALQRALDIGRQLEAHLEQLGLPLRACGADLRPLRRALTAGLFPHAARREPDGTYRVVATGQAVSIHPSSVLCGKKPECVVFNELVRTTKHYARDLCAVEPAWLPELAPAFFAARAGAAAGAVERGGGGG